MDFLNQILNQAKQNIKTIVLPEGKDNRIIDAALELHKQKIVNVKVLINENDIHEGINKLKDANIEVIIIEQSSKLNEYADLLYDIRKNKGLTKEEASKLVYNSIYFGTLMVKNKDVDGMVAGAITSTGNVLKPALQIVKTAKDAKVVSTFFIMDIPQHSSLKTGVYAFSDCGLLVNPDPTELSEIAIQTAKSFDKLTNLEPRIAMLSYSTLGSGKGEVIDKVIKAKELVEKQYPNLKIDGELQLDAAVVPEVAKLKAPSSTVAGYANVLIFPDLQSGNIGYKLVQRFANATAYGPVTQGLAAPINDLSRGCNADDIIAVAALTSLQCKN